MDGYTIATIVYCTTGLLYAYYYLWRTFTKITIRDLLVYFVVGVVAGSAALIMDIIVITYGAITRLLAPIARIGDIVVYHKKPVDKKE